MASFCLFGRVLCVKWNIWKRIRSCLFDLTFGSPVSVICVRPTLGGFRTFDWAWTCGSIGLGRGLDRLDLDVDRDTCFGDSVDSVDSVDPGQSPDLRSSVLIFLFLLVASFSSTRKKNGSNGSRV